MPQTLEKLEGHIALGLCVNKLVSVLVTLAVKETFD